jgi:TonB family protein
LLVVLWRPRFLLPEHTTRVTLLAPIITSSHGGNAPLRKSAAEVSVPERPAPVVETTPVATAKVAVGGFDANTKQAAPVPGHGASSQVMTGVFDDLKSATATGYSREGTVVVGFDGSEPGRQGRERTGSVGFTDMFRFRGNAQGDNASAVSQVADEPARLLSSPSPIYSEEARSLNVKGKVVLEVTLMASGIVRVLRVVSGLGHGLDEAAIAAVNRIRCQPARKAGQPIEVVGTVTVIFDLS